MVANQAKYHRLEWPGHLINMGEHDQPRMSKRVLSIVEKEDLADSDEAMAWVECQTASRYIDLNDWSSLLKQA